MFRENSRYARVAVVEVVTPEGAAVKAVALRRLPAASGSPTVVTDQDRLDVLSQRRFADPTRFWHIADANTELEASALVAQARRTIAVPEN